MLSQRKEEERKYRNALALAKRAERDYKFWATTFLLFKN